VDNQRVTEAPYDSCQDPARETPGALLTGRGDMAGVDLFVRRLPALASRRGQAASPAVLYVHGATFPSGLSVAYPFDGRSWAGEPAAVGLDVWAFDFVGFGRSSRYAQQDCDPAGGAPLGRAGGAAGGGEQVV